MLSQLGVVYAIPFPDVYAHLLRWTSIFQFSLPEIMPLSCIMSFSFYSSLLLRTLMLPALALVVLAVQVARVKRKVVDPLQGGRLT